MSASSSIRIALAQLDLFVGDVDGNARRIIEAASVARDRERADVVVFPELALSGYPPEDLLFHTGMRRRVAEGLARAREEISGIAALIGYPEYVQGQIYNSAALVRDGRWRTGSGPYPAGWSAARQSPQAVSAELQSVR